MENHSVFSFKGRISRSSYFISLIVFFLVINFSYVLLYGSNFQEPFLVFFFLAIYFISYWFILSQGARRCHDVGKSGWMQIIPLYVFWMLFEVGDHGRNKYGENPSDFVKSPSTYGLKTENPRTDLYKSISNTQNEPTISGEQKTEKTTKDQRRNYFATIFGNFERTNSFKQYYLDNPNSIVEEFTSFELERRAIEMFPKTKMYSIKRELHNKKSVISYSVYSSISQRDEDKSWCVGSSILFIDKIAEEYITLNNLNELQETILQSIISNEESAIDLEDQKIQKPLYFDNIGYYLKDIEEIDEQQSSNNSLLVYSKINPDNMRKLFQQSLAFFNHHNTIYFTDSHQIAEFVYSKGIYKVMDANKFDELYQYTSKNTITL